MHNVYMKELLWLPYIVAKFDVARILIKKG